MPPCRGPALSKSYPDSLSFPFPEAPAAAQALPVAPGILWIKLALPFALNHVNVYALEDGAGWTILDTGLGDQATFDVWEALLSGVLAGRPVVRVIASHFHPDHLGAAGWLCRRTDAPLSMSHTEYLLAKTIRLEPDGLKSEPYRRFYRLHGLAEDATEVVMRQGNNFLRMMSEPPPTYRSLHAGTTIRIGTRVFDIMTGGGHAPEQLMFHHKGDGLLLCADQVLARISPNVSVTAFDPDGDPLGAYLRSLDAIRAHVSDDALVLPGHDLPFKGLHARIDSLKAHHQKRCAMLVEACRQRPQAAANFVPLLFPRPLDPQQKSFAFSEALAHVNYLIEGGQLMKRKAADGSWEIALAG